MGLPGLEPRQEMGLGGWDEMEPGRMTKNGIKKDGWDGWVHRWIE